MRRLARAAVLLLLAAAGLAGCRGSTGKPAGACAHVGDQCTLHGNVLGVCDSAPASTTCATPPCLVCTSQH